MDSSELHHHNYSQNIKQFHLPQKFPYTTLWSVLSAPQTLVTLVWFLPLQFGVFHNVISVVSYRLWLLLLLIKPLGFIHIMAHICGLFFELLSTIPYMDISQFVYSFTSWWFWFFGGDFFVVVVVFSKAAPEAYGGSQARALICCHWPTPQPQQLGIRAPSAIYTTAHS